MTRRRLLVLVLAISFALPLGAAADARADFSPVFFTLGAAKLPGIAFDVVGAARIGPSLGDFDTPEVLRRAAQASFVANLVTLGLHTVSVGSFWVVAVLDLDTEERLLGSFVINAVADLSIGVLGLVTGIDVILQRNAAGLTGTALGTAATWSGAVNITMGAFGVIWFLPMTIGALVGATDVLGLRLPPRSPIKALALVPTGAGAALVGRF